MAVNDDKKWFHNFSNSQKKDSKHQDVFKSFDFSYNDVFSTCYSIKFTQSDTVFIKQYFSASSDTVKGNTTYYALLPNADRAKFDSLIKRIKFSIFDTLYYQDYSDGIDYQFYYDNDTIQKRIRIHSNNAPEKLIDLKDWIVNAKQSLRLYRLDTAIGFESAKFFLPPTIPPPILKKRRLK